MANTRSGGGAVGSGAPRDGHTPPPPPSRKFANARETRSATAAAAAAQTPMLRRSTRENKGKHKSKQVPTTHSSHRSATRPIRDASAIAAPISASSPNKPKDSTKKSTRVRNTSVPSSPPSNQDSNGTSTSAPMPASTKRKTEHGAQVITTPSKKQKRHFHTKSYVALFSPDGNPKSPVLATPLREDEENASKVQAEDDGAVLADEEINAQGQANWEPSSVAANKVLEVHSSDLHEMPEVILEGHEMKTGSHQSDLVSEPCMPVELCSLNKAAESISILEIGEQAAGDSNPNSLPELQNRDCSTAHHGEASKAMEDGDSIGIQGACTSRHIGAIQCDETYYNDNMCVGCKSSEISDILKSCDGKGCKRHYHLSCMDPPLDVSLGIWLCITCTKKRLQFGIYSVSEGVESLWDVKEGADSSKQYFVKYKNLAHVHNRWVSESDIISSTLQGRDLISKFSKRIQKEKTIRWKQEWAEPHRLLKRRSLMPQKEAKVFFSSLGDNIAYCNVEWLVKWKCLGYEHATWELETSSFLCTPEAEELKRSYDNRLEAARRVSDPAKVDKVQGGMFQKLHRLPDGCPPGLDDDHLSSLNQLLEFRHKSRGAVFIDDQERVIKTILFITSILPHICRPLLIVSASGSLSLWETKFSRLAASINVVVYNGEKDVRKSIRDLEFFEDGSVMLQVLLSHPDAILEDIEAIGRISWEAVIVDDCQNSRFSKCLEQLKRLPTNFRMVLLSSSLKENIPEYNNLLSFLNPEENCASSVSNGVSFDTAGTLAVLKAKLARHVAFERKADSSKLLEYWVPARLSPVQLEMYCYTLLSNSPALRSHSKTDSVGALRNILISLRKCCDHPYLVDQMLQSSLTKDRHVTDILDIGVRSCGKLLLLDKMLQKIRIEGLRVLILSQSGGGSGNPMGDILDDFVRQRFGFESYERVERGLQLQKKQTAMNMFNDKSKGRFIFLIDSRACGPSIKLSSVDAIIIYGSDWNPVNDLKVLQRVSMESQSERVPIFRLYSSCTVEEKALILAKHDHILDSNILNITPSLSHCLLSWGASFLFNRLEEFQHPSYSCKRSDVDDLFVNNVASEFSTKLPNKVELSTEIDNAVISQAYLRGSFYSRDTVIIGETEGISSVDGDLPKFWAYWSNLLNGRSPCWQLISEPAQRSRRKIQNVDEQLKNTEGHLEVPAEETDEARIKRRRIGEVTDSSPKVPPGKNKDTVLPGNNTPSSSHQISVEDTWQELERNNLHGTQKGLHVQFKQELAKLYKLLQLPENVKSLCEEFLEYILKNYKIGGQEPKNILHAFNIALCWRAASLLKHKVNRTESLTLAVKSLNYECTEEESEYFYGKLKILKKKFARRAGEMSRQNHTASVINVSTCEQTSVKPRNDELIPSQVNSMDGKFETGSHQEAMGDFWTEDMVSGEKELLPDPGTHRECLSRDELLSRIMDNGVKFVDKVFSVRKKSIQDKHSNEVLFLDRHKRKEVAKLREACSLVVEHLRRSQNHIVQGDRDRKIKLVTEWFDRLVYAFLEHMRCQRNMLDSQQSATWTKEFQLKEETLRTAKSGQLDHTFDQHIPLPDSEFAMEEFSHFREVVGRCHVHAPASTQPSLDDDSTMEITLVRNGNASEVVEGVCNRPAEVLVQGPASEVVSLSMNGICKVSDGMGSQGDASLAVHSLEPSGGDHRSTEHVEEESTVGAPLQGVTGEHLGDPAMEVEQFEESTVSVPLQGGAGEHLVVEHAEESVGAQLQGGRSEHLGDAAVEVDHAEEESTVAVPLQSGTSEQLGGAAVEVDTENRNAAFADFDTLALTASRQATLPVSGEAEIQNDLVTQCAQQSLVSSQLSQGESEQADLSSLASAQPLQSERQQSIPVSNNLLERAQPDQSEPSHQRYAAPGSVQSAELFPVASMMFNHPPIDAEPLKNELHRLRLHMDTVNKTYELKKTQLRMECGQEIEKVKRKYDLLIEEHDFIHLQQKKTLDDFYEKVLRNQSLAEDFRAKFISPSAAQARAHTPPVRQTPQASQQVPMRPSVVGSSASSIALSSACRPPAPRLRVQAPQVEQPSSSLSQLSRSPLPSSRVVQPPPLIPGNLFRTSATHMPPPRGSFGVQSELAPRAPAPHLQFKTPRANPMPPVNQQQLPRSRVEATSLRTQPVLAANSSPSDSHLGSMATSGMSSLHSAPQATSLPSSSHPNPTLRVVAAPNPTLRVVAAPSPNTATPSINTGMQRSDSGSLSLDAWLTASLGLSGDAPGATTAPATNGCDIDVVCLSDDESE